MVVLSCVTASHEKAYYVRQPQAGIKGVCHGTAVHQTVWLSIRFTEFLLCEDAGGYADRLKKVGFSHAQDVDINICAVATPKCCTYASFHNPAPTDNTEDHVCITAP